MNPNNAGPEGSTAPAGWGDVHAPSEPAAGLAAEVQRLQDLLAQTSDWFWETDAQHRFVRFDGDWRAQVARSRSLGLRPWEVPAPNMTAADWARVAALLDAHEPIRDLEVARLHADGSLQWAQINGQPRFGAHGEFLGYRGVARDVTGFKRSEENRDRQLEVARALTERVPGLVFQLRRSASGWYSFPFASAGMYDLFQVSPEQVLVDAAPALARVVPEDLEACRRALDASARAHTPWVQSYRVQLPDGRTLWHSANAVPYPDEEGATVWYGFTSDVTERMQAEERLQRAHEHLRSRTHLMEVTLGSLSQGVMMIAPDASVTYYNERLLDLLDMPASLLARQPHVMQLVEWQFERGDFGPDLTRDALAAYCDIDASGALRFMPDYVRTTREGRKLEVKTRPLGSGGWVRTFSDVTDYFQAQQAQQRSELHLRALFDGIPDRVWLKDTEGAFIMCNPPAARAFRIPEDRLVGHTEFDLSPAKGLMPGHLETDLRALRSPVPVVYEQELPLEDRNGTGVFEVVKRAVFDHDGEPIGVLGMARDVTERKRAEAQIERLAFFDPLTGLCNRRLFHDRLEQAQAASTRSQQWGAVCFIDLDNFKDLNDTQGHDQGDLLLQQVGQRLQATVREQDTVARLGGDEFVVLLEMLGPQEQQAALYAHSVGEKLLDALTTPYHLARGLHHNTPSIGITLFRDHQERVEDILKRADLAMYQSKSAGRNTVRFFNPQMQDVVQRRSELERDLREAVNQQHFMLYSQQVMGVGDQVSGFEVLLRWRHPQRGMVSPAEFIPVAEQTGLILPIGEWVLRTACQQLAQWSTSPATAGWTLAVNLSARQLRQADFVQTVEQILHETGASPTHLKLELTESLLLHDVEDTIVKMNRLAALGIRFSLDDFGTGYSSLSYLKRLPLSLLKIDQSFVRDLLTDPNDAAIARTILQLAQSLDLDVVAEGVETEGQKQFLQIMGCHAFQGYLFGRPAPL